MDAERLEHEEFMRGLAVLRDEIFSRWLSRPTIYDEINAELADIKTYGTEPTFSFLLWEKVLEEEAAKNA